MWAGESQDPSWHLFTACLACAGVQVHSPHTCQETQDLLGFSLCLETLVLSPQSREAPVDPCSWHEAQSPPDIPFPLTLLWQVGYFPVSWLPAPSAYPCPSPSWATQCPLAM